jgi:hypothetical protein
MKILGKSIEELFDLCDAPKELIPVALESIKQAKKINEKARKYVLSAPLVMAWVCPRLPWEAEELPAKYRMWDNEVSINGDKGNWYYDEANHIWGRYPIPLTKGNSKNNRGKWYNYYTFKKLSARHWFARYVWLGWRNRASAAYLEHDVYAPKPEEIKDIQKWEYRTEEEGIEILYWNGYMQVFYQRHGKVIHRRANLGFKLGNVNEITKKIRAVYTPFSFKVRPGQPLRD